MFSLGNLPEASTVVAFGATTWSMSVWTLARRLASSSDEGTATVKAESTSSPVLKRLATARRLLVWISLSWKRGESRLHGELRRHGAIPSGARSTPLAWVAEAAQLAQQDTDSRPQAVVVAH